jgi:lipid-binding SYLF domain-containing protein
MATLAIGSTALTPTALEAADNAEVDAKANASLNQLYTENSAAAELSQTAAGILIFPDIKKAGLGVGGEVGKGVLRVNGVSDGYYRTVSLSIGAQAGFQSYGYAIMFLTQDALNDFTSKKGFELGVDGSVAVLDEGASIDIDTNNLQADTVGFVFDEAGLMASATIEGSKITRLDD